VKLKERRIGKIEMGDYKLSKAGLYYMLRCRFNDRDFTPNLKTPRDVLVRIYRVWLKDTPHKFMNLVIWDSWGSFTGISIKDKCCIDELFTFNDYDNIKFKKLQEFVN